MATLLPRRVAGILTFLVTAVAAVAFAAPAHAEDGYKYWMYFHLSDDQTWAFSDVGPADHQPADGDVEGFRFGVSTASKGIEPRADLAEVNFETICADAEAGSGEKRVALVLDYGTDIGEGAPPEPQAECAVVDEAASTQQILDEVTDLRVENGMTCALGGYPAAGCGEPVANAEVPTDEEPVAFALPAADTDDAGTADAAAVSEDGEPWLLAGLVAVIAVMAAAALLMARRRKTA